MSASEVTRRIVADRLPFGVKFCRAYGFNKMDSEDIAQEAAVISMEKGIRNPDDYGTILAKMLKHTKTRKRRLA